MKLKFPEYHPEDDAPYEWPLTDLLIRTIQPVGLLPTDIVIQLPREHACLLIMRKQAIPVGLLSTQPQLVIDEADIDLALGLSIANEVAA